MNIVLIGITGVGKTTIGKLIAENLKKTFIDLDKSIENRCGVDIPTIFEIEGEEKFREREATELKDVINNSDDYVLSVGGGCIVSAYNRQIISNVNGVVIQLFADIPTLVERLSKSIVKRPLFNNQDIAKKVTDLYQTRKDFYDKITDINFDTSGMHQSQVADKIIKIIKNY